MFRVISCLTTEHDARLVVLAGVVCLLASLVAISLFNRASAAQGGVRRGWLALAGAATGCGIWATHFIAMLAYEASVGIGYNVERTVLSLAVAVAVTICGMGLAANNRPFAAPIGGAVVGAGIAAMHYIGMSALELPGFLVWDTNLVIVSVALGILFAGAALTVSSRTTGALGGGTASILLALAILSHHFTGMGAVQIASDPLAQFAASAVSDAALALAVAGAAIAVLGMSLVGAIADNRLSKREREFATDRKELIKASEGRLREQNLRLDTALNNMSQGLCMFDADERIVVFNRRFMEMYRLSPQVVRPGCTLRELIQHRFEVGLLESTPEDYYQGIMRDIRLGRSTSWLSTTTDGRTIQALNQPMPNGGWVTTHQDVTERLQAEERVREQKLQLDTALDNMSQGLLMFDSNARLILCNARYVQLYDLPSWGVRPGVTLQEILEIRKSRNTFSGDPAEYVANLRSVLAEGRPFVLTTELADGRTIAVENHPMADGWVSTHDDITEERRVEKQLREQKLHLDTALNNMSQGLNLFDSAGRLVVCNDRYLEMYRLSADTVKPGCSVNDLVHARIAAGTFFAMPPERYIEELLAAMQKREPTSSTMTLTDGRTVSVLSQPTPDGSGWVVTHEDVSERRRAEIERDRSQAFADTVIENVPVTIVVKDAADLRYRLINRAAEKYFGVKRDEVIGKTAAEVFAPDVAGLISEHDRKLIKDGKPQHFDEHPVIMPNGEGRIIASTRLPICDADGKPQYLLSVVDDRTHRKRAEAQIAKLVHHDALTGIPNRLAFTSCIDATIEQAAREKSSFALLCLDFDRFKEVNDVYGHDAGDEVLRQVARRLQEAIGGAFLSRLGGDEFVVIATDGAHPDAAEEMAERIVAAIEKDFVIDGHKVRTGVSIGIAIYPENGTSAAALVANADAALHRAKNEGRGLFRFFEAGTDKNLRERRALQQDLRSAIERNELALCYQPQAKVGGNVFGFEALVRWHHPKRGTISPGTFIPIAEESGLIVSLGEWILREACREAASWPNPHQIAINLSPIQFRQGDLPALVHQVLLETGLAPSRLELEITEGVLIGDFSRAVSTLRRLKALGVRIAMDDFGTGYSSLSYLQAFPFDKIKIDQTFIGHLGDRPQSAAIVRAVIGLARGLGLPVLAEGVETEEQLAFLARESCDEVQGYLLGRPRPIDDYAGLTGALDRRARLGAAIG